MHSGETHPSRKREVRNLHRSHPPEQETRLPPRGRPHRRRAGVTGHVCPFEMWLMVVETARNRAGPHRHRHLQGVVGDRYIHPQSNARKTISTKNGPPGHVYPPVSRGPANTWGLVARRRPHGTRRFVLTALSGLMRRRSGVSRCRKRATDALERHLAAQKRPVPE